MPIKCIIRVEEDLKKTLAEILENSRDSFDIQGIIRINHKGIDNKDYLIACLYLKDKYAEFHGEFIKTANTNPKLRLLINYLIRNDWESNLEQSY
jgi:hypothetical protein